MGKKPLLNITSQFQGNIYDAMENPFVGGHGFMDRRRGRRRTFGLGTKRPVAQGLSPVHAL
jgi:hypothetical protein